MLQSVRSPEHWLGAAVAGRLGYQAFAAGIVEKSQEEDRHVVPQISFDG
jgi:hypothetical protein